ncbi:hypothetical protein BGZ76_008064 [Entomortierella beljakovae]|nr:hypothetical protein BGZ76_008064 [Entomortierella beljakovae]
MLMDAFQMIQQNGAQELVEVSRDEDSLPCIFLEDIERIFPNAIAISSYGVRIHFAIDETRTPKQPLRIPYFENRVLDVESDHSSLVWSRENTEIRYAVEAASGYTNAPDYSGSFGHINTLHTDQLPGILDLDPIALADSDDAANENDMLESESESSEEEQEEQLSRPRLSIMSPTISSSSTTAGAPTLPSTPTRVLRTVQSLSSIPLEPVPEHTPFTRETPPSFDQIPPLNPSRSHRTIIEDTELEEDAVPPPEYLLLDPNTSGNLSSNHPNGLITAIDDPSERHLVRERIEIIKDNCKTILGHVYEAASCLHPPLFIILPDNPTRWSYDNILHNKIRLYFLCNSCDRTVHINLSSSFELRMDQYQDQQLLIKFGHYILCLLRMLRYGVSFNDIFVPAAFDRPVPPILSIGNLGETAGSDPELFFRNKINIERSIAYMESLLGDDYEENSPNLLGPLIIDDFRILDIIIKRNQRANSNSAAGTASPASTGALDMGQDIAFSNIHSGSSGMYRILNSNDRIQWSCDKYYVRYHRSLDTIFYKKLEQLQVSLNPITRSVAFVATTGSQLSSKMTLCSHVKSLFHVDITFDWGFEKAHLETLANLLKHEATSVTSIAARFSKRSPPLVWKKNLPVIAGDDQQPLSAILNLVKSRRIRHLVLEGDINLTSVPNIGNMDLTNLDSLSIMKTNTRNFNFNNGANSMSSGSSVHSNENLDATGSLILSLNRGQAQDSYIPELVSFLQACSFLTEITLGFPELVPGHIRILQACVSSLNRLRRVDLFRALVTGNTNGNIVSKFNHKLELSASISSGRIKRLYMAECKATGENKLRLLESLEELLTDDASNIEDLELRYIGFNDKHAHALELGTRPTPEQYCTRLRRLVIQGNGLEHGGVFALRKVLKRATALSKFNMNNGNTPAATSNSEIITYGNLLENPTLTHLELSSVDSLLDSDWAELLGDMDLQHVITLHLQGVGFGDRAIAALTRSSVADNSSSPQQSPTDNSFARSSFASQTENPLPPSSFSTSSLLPLQTLELSSPSLSHEGVACLQELLSRLVHLSTISFHGFRKVTPGQWADIMARISFQWIEVVEIVSNGFNDDCASYLGERIRSRDQASEAVVTHSEPIESSNSALPPYIMSAATVTATTTSVVNTTTASTSSVSLDSAPISHVSRRRDSLSSKIFGILPLNASPARSNARDRDMNMNRVEEMTMTTPVTQSTPTQKYLEIDLRYTGVSPEGLTQLQSMMSGIAQRVIVRTHNEEGEGEGGDDDNVNEIAQLTGNRLPAPLFPSVRNSGGNGASTSVSPPRNGINSKKTDTSQQPQQHTRSPSAFSKFRMAFKKS